MPKLLLIKTLYQIRELTAQWLIPSLIHMRSFGAIFRGMLGVFIIFVMMMAPIQGAAASVYVPDLPKVTSECAGDSCHCGTAKSECSKSLTCATQCANTPMLQLFVKLELPTATTEFLSRNEDEPAPWGSGALRRPPRY